MTTQNEKGRASREDAAPTTRANDKDMSTAAQRKRVLEYLTAGPQTTYSLRARGISHPAARVRELILAGHRISSAPVTAADSDGHLHVRVALYALTCARDLLSGAETAQH